MKTCDDVMEKILSGMVNDPEVTEHIVNCPDCKQLMEDAAAFRLSPDAGVPSPALDTAIHNMAILEQEHRKERPLIFRRAIFRTGAAAVLAVCACIAGIFLVPENRSTPVLAENTKNNTVQAEMQQFDRFLYTTEGEKELFNLSMEIQRADEMFASVNSAGSRFYNY